MSESALPADQGAQPPGPQRAVSLRALAWGYLLIGLNGFGGVQPSARRFIVDVLGWLPEADYAAVLGVGQILPGANTVNAAVIIGDRFQGWRGSVVAVLSLMAAPLAVLVACAALYARFGALPDVKAALAGAAAGGAGLILGSGLRMALRLRTDLVGAGVGVAAFLAVGVFGASMPLTVLVLAPLGVALAAWRTRPGAAR